MSSTARTLRLGLAFVVAATALTVSFRSIRMDDAYISYQYGRNLAEGRGFAFNAGERRLGTTAPGHALIAAGLLPVAGPEGLPALMSALGAIAWATQALLMFLLLAPRLGTLAAGAGGVAVLVGAAGSASVVPMETNLVAAAALAALAAAERGRAVPAAAAAGVAALLRLDAALLALVLAAFYGGRELRGPRRASLARRALGPLLAFLAPLLPWLVFATVQFGSPLPATAAAKVNVTPPAEYALHILRDGPERLFGQADPVAVTMGVALAGGGAVAAWRAGGAVALLPVWAALHAVAFLALRPLTLFRWHLYPYGLVFVTLAFVALALLARSRQRALRVAGPLAAATLALVVGARTAAAPGSWRNSYWGGQRHDVYVALADWLKARTPPGDRVAILEVGTVGYYSQVRLVDKAGLVTPWTGELPAGTRFEVMVSHQWPGHLAGNAPPPSSPLHQGRAPVAEFRRGRFAAWVYVIG